MFSDNPRSRQTVNRGDNNGHRLISFSFVKRRSKKILALVFGTSAFIILCYHLPHPPAVPERQVIYSGLDRSIASRLLAPGSIQVPTPGHTISQSIDTKSAVKDDPNTEETFKEPANPTNLTGILGGGYYDVAHDLGVESISTPPEVVAEVSKLKNARGHQYQNETNLIPAVANDVSEAQLVNLACKLPNLDPFSPEIRRFLTPPEQLECEDVIFPLLFDLQNDVLVRLKNREWQNYDKCCISNITREPDNDDDVIISQKCKDIKHVRTKIPEEIETFVVSCFEIRQKQWLDIDIFSIPRLRPEVDERIAQTPPLSPEAVNVVILGLDAISHMNFQRTMPRTHEFLKQNLSALYFDGYTKVGDNTFPNIMPLLTGKSQKEILASCWRNESDFLDDCPYIWSSYSEKGYRTSLGEDLPQISTFNYLRNGFKSPPTDHYHRPMYIAQDLYIGHQDLLNANLCYGPRTTFNVAFDYIKRLATLMGTDKRYFAFSWVNSIFHDYLNAPSLADQSLLLTLIWLQNQGYLEDTAFILMSDHGMRWGDIRDTLQGKIEERMPFFYIALPPRFKSNFPFAIKNMKINQNRLTTHFDAHETLLDLLFLERLSPKKLSQREEGLKQDTMPRGISLFLPIPPKRKCNDAGIDDHWCVCSRMIPLDVRNNSDAQAGANEILRFINTKLEDWQQCARLKIRDVVRASEKITERGLATAEEVAEEEDGALTPEISTKNTGKDRIFDITIKTSPGLAVFEATVSKNSSGKFKVVGAISRTNLYGKQSHCVKEANIRLICYCVDLLKGRKNRINT